MRRDVHNWPELVEAVKEMTGDELPWPRVIVFHDTMQRTFRFVLGEHGLVKIDSDKQGEEL